MCRVCVKQASVFWGFLNDQMGKFQLFLPNSQAIQDFSILADQPRGSTVLQCSIVTSCLSDGAVPYRLQRSSFFSLAAISGWCALIRDKTQIHSTLHYKDPSISTETESHSKEVRPGLFAVSISEPHTAASATSTYDDRLRVADYLAKYQYLLHTSSWSRSPWSWPGGGLKSPSMMQDWGSVHRTTN